MPLQGRLHELERRGHASTARDAVPDVLWFSMSVVLILSSYVAGSRVGGGIAPFVLGPAGIDPVLVPTTLFGRHPGWGTPGGGLVTAETMEHMLDGIAEHGLFERAEAVLTGYFATPDQAEIAARAIDAVREARGPDREPFVLVDPIIGDSDKGRFVSEEVALAQASHLVPRADLVACNLWEFQHLAGPAETLEQAAERALASDRNWMVGSIPFEGRIANLLVENGHVCAAAADIVPDPVPKGAGDLFKLVFLGQRLKGATSPEALQRAVGAVEAVLMMARVWRSRELPLAQCQSILANPPESGYVVQCD